MPERLMSFNELEDPQELIRNLLIGNGFSICFSNRFKYGSLLDECRELLPEDRELFGTLKTSNFEACLKTIHDSMKVNEIYGMNRGHDACYERIKNSLISTVRRVHIDWDRIEFPKKHQARSLFKNSINIFTTNYDLVSYWFMLESEQYGDYFGGHYVDGQRVGDLYFSKSNSQNKDKKIYYLHGALHLYEDNGKVKKLERNGNRLLDEVERKMNEGFPPLFVSEGDSDLKMKAIEFNPYLSFCYDKLTQINGAITIFGHRLDTQTDGHIVEAINSSEVQTIACGIFSGDKLETAIERECSEIRDYFRNKEVVFFESSSLFPYNPSFRFGGRIWGEPY